ncbi:MAG: hypothetical protein ACOX6T_01425 [Myxococcales bacterium]|jgi:hypothetical protein
MSKPLFTLCRELGLALPAQLAELYRALPEGADLGTVRLLSPAEVAAGRWRADLSPALLPIAEEGSLDLFALYVPPGPAAAASVVCAVNVETGAYAPFCSSVRGFAAWLLLLRQAQARLPMAGSLAADTREAAGALAAAFGLEPVLGQSVELDSGAIAAALAAYDPSSPWACSLLARDLAEPAAARERLAPALAAAPFASGLLEQAAELFIARGETGRAARSLAAAIQRLEPNLQAAPYRLEEPSEDTWELFEPFKPLAGVCWLREHAREIPPDFRQSAAKAFLERRLETRPGGELTLEPREAIDFARRRGLGGDLPGGRWVLHLAFGVARGDPEARRLLAAELEKAWRLAGSSWYANGFAQIAGGSGD